MDSFSLEDTVRTLRAYAAGDAFGVRYEFTEFDTPIDPLILQERAGWPFGGVSDDTLLSLLTINSLQNNDPSRAAKHFLSELQKAIPVLRGLGPTTRSALGLPVKDHEQSEVGISNGALMRTALLGLAFTPEQATVRRSYVCALAEVTHSSRSAVESALVGAALFSDARTNGDAHNPFDIAMQERGAIHSEIALLDWQEPSENQISNESVETLNAVLWTAKTSNLASEALKNACEMGGDTDTVAALSTALLVARSREKSGFDSLPWLSEILWSEISQLPFAAQVLFDGNIESGGRK